MTETRETRIETYIPLYRKYRPQAFADLVGQEAISQTLGNAINLNKVAHAYLFCGPRGTGKTSTARIFAKSLNCEQGPTVTPCMQCASCVGITQGNALDVIEFDAASNNGVNDARELIENCQYSSMTGRFKVYIIDEVHMLTSQAFNALLKTLEEPPPNVIFIFATTEAHKVLPTIISRCQRFDFNRITTENIVSRLRYIAEQEAITIDDEALLMIARHARGGLRDAVGLLDQVAVLGRAQPGKVIGRKDVAMFIGTLEEDLLLRLSGAIAQRQAADLLNELNELLNRGIEPIQLLKDLTVHFRNLLLVQTVGANANPELLSLPPDYFRQLAEQAALFPEVEEVPQIIGRLSFVERNIRNSSQPQLWLEVGLIELAYRHEIQLVKDLSERVSRLESQLTGQAPMPMPAGQSAPAAAPVAPARPKPSQQAPMPAQPAMPPATQSAPAHISQAMPPSPQPVAAQAAAPAKPAAASGSLEGMYAQVCAAIPSLMFRSLLQQQTFPMSLDGDVLTLGCLSDAHLNTLKKPDKFTHLQRAVDKVYGRPIRIDVVLNKNKPASSMVAAPAAPAARPVQVPAPAPEPVMAAAAPAANFANPAPVQALSEPAPSAPAQGGGSLIEAMAMMDDDGPPEMDMPPFDDDDEPPFDLDDEDDTPVSSVQAPATPMASGSLTSGDVDLSEAKKHAVELLQGRILE
jgi:DNA polymerase-3 subunit gamma/tau